MNLFQTCTPSLLELINHLDMMPWEVTDDLEHLLPELAKELDSSYARHDQAFIHPTARVHPTAILQDQIIIGPNATVGPHAMLRGGVWLGENAHIGGSAEIKQSIIGPRSAAAHLNYIGNSIIGADVNLEAGSVIANHLNERGGEAIRVLVDGAVVETGTNKFGALVGDGCRIGANAVTSPGTILLPGTVVNRLELVVQIPFKNTAPRP